ncbi:hypothetical protein ABKN59_007922 [Abortiporus biennis]
MMPEKILLAHTWSSTVPEDHEHSPGGVISIVPISAYRPLYNTFRKAYAAGTKLEHTTPAKSQLPLSLRHYRTHVAYFNHLQPVLRYSVTLCSKSNFRDTFRVDQTYPIYLHSGSVLLHPALHTNTWGENCIDNHDPFRLSRDASQLQQARKHILQPVYGSHVTNLLSSLDYNFYQSSDVFSGMLRKPTQGMWTLCCAILYRSPTAKNCGCPKVWYNHQRVSSLIQEPCDACKEAALNARVGRRH